MQAKKKRFVYVWVASWLLLFFTCKHFQISLIFFGDSKNRCVVTCFVLSFELLQTAEESQNVKARLAKIQVQYPHHVFFFRVTDLAHRIP